MRVAAVVLCTTTTAARRISCATLHCVRAGGKHPSARRIFRCTRLDHTSPGATINIICEYQPPKPGIYAVAVGVEPGLYTTWDECERQVKGYPNAKYKKFKTELEARAYMNEMGGGAASSFTVAAGPVISPLAIVGGSQPDDHQPRYRRGRAERTADGDHSRQDGRGSRPNYPAFTARIRRSASPEQDRRSSSSRLPAHLLDLSRKGYRFTDTEPHHLVAYTDGSGLGNGQRGARAGSGVWWGSEGDASQANLAERVPGELQTNNRGEILAVIRAIETCPFPDLPLEIRTDSEYTIKCMTEYLPKWIRNGYLTGPTRQGGPKVKNADMIKHLLVLLRRRGPRNAVKFKHVSAHVGIQGNEGADRLAKMGAMMPALADRTQWLDPEEQDEEEDRAGPSSAVHVEVEVEPEWLLSNEELAELEYELL